MMARDRGWNEYDHDEMIARVAVSKALEEGEKEDLQVEVDEIVKVRLRKMLLILDPGKGCFDIMEYTMGGEF